jgi:D-3-phosphoglycerate dehydrogenase
MDMGAPWPRAETASRPERVAVLSRSFSRHKVLRAELLAEYPEAVFNDTGATLAGQALIEFLAPHEAAIVALETIDEALLAALPTLRILSKYGVGLDNIDLDAAARHGVKIAWQAGVNRRSVAELAISYMICGLRGVMVSFDEVRRGIWRQYVGRQLSDATVGLIGFGHVGGEVAGLLRAFGSRVLAYDIRDIAEPAARLGVETVALDELLARSDVVSLHVPFTPKTANLIGAAAFAAMKPGVVVVNVARGGLVDETALATGLRTGHVAAACFDVFAREPPVDSELFSMPEFLGTAHIGGSAEEAILAMGRAALHGLAAARDPHELISACGV